MMPDPRLCAGEVEGDEEVAGCLEASHGGAPEVSDAVEELHDPAALPVELAIHGPNHADIAMAGNASPCARGFDGGDHRPAEAAAIGGPVAGRSGRPGAVVLPEACPGPSGSPAGRPRRSTTAWIRSSGLHGRGRWRDPRPLSSACGVLAGAKNCCRPIGHRKQMSGFGRGFSLRLSKVAPNLLRRSVGAARRAMLAQRPARPRIPLGD